MTWVVVGVVSGGAGAAGPAPRAGADNYLVAGDGRAMWREGERERSVPVRGDDWLLAAIEGEAVEPAAAADAAEAVARVLCKLVQPDAPQQPAVVLARYLAEAHTRMFWKAREAAAAKLGASAAIAWVVEGRLAWATVGTAAAWVVRGGRLVRLGRPWPDGERQRLIRGSRGLGDDAALHLQHGVNVGEVALVDGDRVLLGTHALGRSVEETTLLHTLATIDTPQLAAVALHEAALAQPDGGPAAVLVADVSGVPAAPTVLRPQVGQAESAPEDAPAAPRRSRRLLASTGHDG